MNSDSVTTIAQQQVRAMLDEGRLGVYFPPGCLAEQYMQVAFLKGASAAIKATTEILRPVCVRQG